MADPHPPEAALVECVVLETDTRRHIEQENKQSHSCPWSGVFAIKQSQPCHILGISAVSIPTTPC
jgi:hypothetical protein